MPSTTLLTVPHANCGCEGPHPCDSVAEATALSIHRHAPRTTLSPFIPSQPRGRCDCDLNRKQCRDHPWRRALAAHFFSSSPSSSFLLDLHSYPPDEEAWASYDFVVLDNSPVAEPYTRAFIARMRRRGWRTECFRGGENDIQNEAREAGMAAFLLEVNEGLSERRREELAVEVAGWLESVGGEKKATPPPPLHPSPSSSSHPPPPSVKPKSSPPPPPPPLDGGSLPQRVRVVLRKLKTHFSFSPDKGGTVVSQAADRLRKVLGRPLASHWTAEVRKTKGGKRGAGGVTVEVKEQPAFAEVDHIRATPRNGSVVAVQVNERGKVRGKTLFLHKGSRSLDEEARGALERERVQVPSGAVLRVVDLRDFGGRLLLSYDVGVEERWWRRWWRENRGVAVAGVVAAAGVGGVLEAERWTRTGKEVMDIVSELEGMTGPQLVFQLDQEFEAFKLKFISPRVRDKLVVLKNALDSGRIYPSVRKVVDDYLVKRSGYFLAFYQTFDKKKYKGFGEFFWPLQELFGLKLENYDVNALNWKNDFYAAEQLLFLESDQDAYVKGLEKMWKVYKSASTNNDGQGFVDRVTDYMRNNFNRIQSNLTEKQKGNLRVNKNLRRLQPNPRNGKLGS